MKLDKTDEVFTETVQVYLLSDVLVCCHPEILLLWQRDVTTSPLYYGAIFWGRHTAQFPAHPLKGR